MPELHLVAERAGLDSAWQFLLRAQTDRDPLNRFTAAGNLRTLALIEGRLRETERRYQETRRMSMPPGSPELARDDSMTSILHAVWFLGAREEGARRLDALLARHPVRSWPERQRPYLQVAAMYAWAGRPDHARAVLADWAAEQRDPVTRSRSEPERHRALGEIALAERRPADAIAEFRQADQLRDGPADDCTICLSANLARAYDLAGNADSAIAHFERYLTTPYYNRVVNVALDPLLLAGTHKRLGELYEAKGDRARALAHYVAFVELWKDADPELQPKVAEVRGRIARLREGEGR